MNEADFIAALREHWMTTYIGSALQLWDDDESQGQPDQYWLRLAIRSSGSTRPVVGRSRENHNGVIMIQMYGPRTEGPGKLERDASAVADIFRSFRHPRIRLDAPSVIGLPTEGAFNRRLVTLGWRGDMRF